MVTTDDLKELQYLPKELQQIDFAIDQLKRPPLWSMNHTQRKDYAAAVAELIEIYQDRRQRCAVQLEGLRRFLDGIQDDFTRDIFRLRYECGKTWLNISNDLYDRGFYYAEDTTKKMCHRYLERYNRNEAGRKDE